MIKTIFLIGLAALLLGGSMWGIGAMLIGQSKLLMAQGVETQARISQKSVIGGGASRARQFHLETLEQPPTSLVTRVSQEIFEQSTVGDQIDVVYLPGRLDVVALGTREEVQALSRRAQLAYRAGTWVALLGVLICLAATWTLRWQRFRERQAVTSANT